MNKLQKVAAAFGVAVAAGTTMTVTATPAGAESFTCYEVLYDTTIYEYRFTPQGAIAKGRLLRGYASQNVGVYWAVQWWKYGAGDTTWESLWTVSSPTDNDYVDAGALRTLSHC